MTSLATQRPTCATWSPRAAWPIAADSEITVDDAVLTELRGLQPDVQHHHVAGAGHSVHRDGFGSVAAGLVSFLRRVLV